MAGFPTHPKHPERICWGCDKLCPADDLRCGNGSIRAPHPVELFGDDWWEWSQQQEAAKAPTAAPNLHP
jgi:Protein of unknown function (DUF3079)